MTELEAFVATLPIAEQPAARSMLSSTSAIVIERVPSGAIIAIIPADSKAHAQNLVAYTQQFSDHKLEVWWKV